MHDYNRLATRAMTGARLDHFIAETARVREAADAFAAGDITRIGALAAASQADADRVLRNQVPQTRDLVTLALEHGAAAASSFGAGWGGSVWALVETAAAAPFLDAWLGAYRAHHPGLASTAFIAPPAHAPKSRTIISADGHQADSGSSGPNNGPGIAHAAVAAGSTPPCTDVSRESR